MRLLRVRVIFTLIVKNVSFTLIVKNVSTYGTIVKNVSTCGTIFGKNNSPGTQNNVRCKTCELGLFGIVLIVCYHRILNAIRIRCPPNGQGSQRSPYDTVDTVLSINTDRMGISSKISGGVVIVPRVHTRKIRFQKYLELSIGN